MGTTTKSTSPSSRAPEDAVATKRKPSIAPTPESAVVSTNHQANGVRPSQGSKPHHGGPRTATELLGGSFNGAVDALSQALGDPTRREIYLYVREYGPTTARDIGRQFQLHPNVARHHLDRLCASGYLEATFERSTPSQVGRPSKQYQSTGAPLLVDSLGEQATLLGRLLARALAMLDHDSAECLAFEVGLDYGREIGQQMSGNEATKSIATSLKLVADALTRSGFASREDSHDDTLGLRNRSCPFGALVADHPVLCMTERGIIQGLLESLAIDGDLARVEPHPGGTSGCNIRIHSASDNRIAIRARSPRLANNDQLPQ
jgi:predicted ArsR family transcriptional regulator